MNIYLVKRRCCPPYILLLLTTFTFTKILNFLHRYITTSRSKIVENNKYEDLHTRKTTGDDHFQYKPNITSVGDRLRRLITYLNPLWFSLTIYQFVKPIKIAYWIVLLYRFTTKKNGRSFLFNFRINQKKRIIFF